VAASGPAAPMDPSPTDRSGSTRWFDTWLYWLDSRYRRFESNQVLVTRDRIPRRLLLFRMTRGTVTSVGAEESQLLDSVNFLIGLLAAPRLAGQDCSCKDLPPGQIILPPVRG